MIEAKLIRKLRLKKGCKYIIFFPRSSGLFAEELARLSQEYIELSFLLEDTKGIKVIENEE